MSFREFKEQVKNRGLARTNRYEVSIPQFPNINDAPRIATLFCDAANLPGMNIGTMPQRFYGEAWEMPYERMFDPVTLSFYMDSSMVIKQGFDMWQARIIDPVTREINYYKNYIQDIDIKLLNVDENQSPYGVRLFEAYPKTVNSISLDATGRDVMRLQVSIQYRYWRPLASAVASVNTPPVTTPPYRPDPQGITTGASSDLTAEQMEIILGRWGRGPRER